MIHSNWYKNKFVNRATLQDWWDKYEKLTVMVVPRSSQLVTQDGENALVTVTLFRKVVDEFKHHAREHKYSVLNFFSKSR